MRYMFDKDFVTTTLVALSLKKKTNTKLEKPVYWFLFLDCELFNTQGAVSYSHQNQTSANYDDKNH
jgi:hypothetical protein